MLQCLIWSQLPRWKVTSKFHRILRTGVAEFNRSFGLCHRWGDHCEQITTLSVWLEKYTIISAYLHDLHTLLIHSVTRQKSDSVGPFHGRHDFTRIQPRHPEPLLEGWIGEPRLFWGGHYLSRIFQTRHSEVGVFTATLSDQKEKSCERHRVYRKDKNSVMGLMDFVQLFLWKSPDFCHGDPVQSCIKCWFIATNLQVNSVILKLGEILISAGGLPMLLKTT